jgi:hypothetical protein
MRRRKFIGITTIGITTLGLTGIGCRDPNGGFGNVWNRPIQLSHICDIKTIREIGMAYKSQTPAESDPKRLAELLMTDVAGNKVLTSAGDPFIRSLLDQKISQDFKTGNIVTVNGWILAETEARQCALFFIKP